MQQTSDTLEKLAYFSSLKKTTTCSKYFIAIVAFPRKERVVKQTFKIVCVFFVLRKTS